ncbi:MAG: hypothetical protein EXS05_03060 [Planctomycetaceae bacterium]|nr:hypothetical protein [Planctomycetaceae bacterium]
MSGKNEERWQRLAALGAKREIPTPDGEAKMSAVILQLADPLIRQHGKTPARAEAILALAVAGLNKSMFPPEEQTKIEKDLIEAFVPKGGLAEDIGVVLHIMDIIAERREELFPELRKIVVDYDVVIANSRLTLSTTSATLPNLDSATKRR